MKLTKAQRHKVYKLALIEFKKWPLSVGLCSTIRGAARMMGISYDELTVIVFPEFGIQEPKRHGFHWWPMNENGSKNRLRVLNKCIRETAPKKRKKVSNQTK